MFKAGYQFFLRLFKDESTKKIDNKINKLIEYIEKLKKTIQHSRFIMSLLINKIRENGRLKIINKLNHNPKHPRYESSFPELIHDNINNQSKNINNLDSDDFDENFNDVQEINDISAFISNIKKDIRNTKRSNNNYFMKNNTSDIFNQLISVQKNQSNNKNEFKIETKVEDIDLENIYKDVDFNKDLNKYFMIDYHSAVFFIDGHLVASPNKEDMLKDFKRLIPNEIEQKIIATYANPTLLKQSYQQLINERPELLRYRIVGSKNFYEINHLENGTIELVAKNTSNFYLIDANDVQENHSFEIRSNVIISLRNGPTIKHSHFVD
ncbi:hypothetical protein [Buchnera aphidicola]|uniref:hypothetical protein n=1 Tax=Buchnera aphidicola TaxID=9 RepID=UPI003463FD07